jgi:hypothetical protein
MTLLGNAPPDSDLRDKLGKSIFIIDNDDNIHSWFSTRLIHKLAIELYYEIS